MNPTARFLAGYYSDPPPEGEWFNTLPRANEIDEDAYRHPSPPNRDLGLQGLAYLPEEFLHQHVVADRQQEPDAGRLPTRAERADANPTPGWLQTLLTALAGTQLGTVAPIDTFYDESKGAPRNPYGRLGPFGHSGGRIMPSPFPHIPGYGPHMQAALPGMLGSFLAAGPFAYYSRGARTPEDLLMPEGKPTQALEALQRARNR